MSVENFVNDIVEQIENNVCYLAIMPTDQGYDIEAEVNDHNIAGNYSTNTNDIKEARKVANLIEKELLKHNVEVAKTRSEWEDILSNL